MEDLELPPQIIAKGQEPMGERVNVYQKMDLITKIIDALKEEELAFFRESPLGKLLEISTKSSWSRSSGLFLLSRQLEVNKENKIWVLFGVTPLRFSLREFKIVTGLACGKYPNIAKKKRRGTADIKTSYYGTLFGLEEDVTVERVISNLKKKSIGDVQMRLRYTCLALVDGILMSTTHYPKIRVIKDPVEMVENLDVFLAYPWGGCLPCYIIC